MSIFERIETESFIKSTFVVSGISYVEWTWDNGITSQIACNHETGLIRSIDVGDSDRYLIETDFEIVSVKEPSDDCVIIFDDIKNHLEEISLFNQNVLLLTYIYEYYEFVELEKKFKICIRSINSSSKIIWFYSQNNFVTIHMPNMKNISLDEFNSSDFNKPITILEFIHPMNNLILMPKRTNYMKLNKQHIPNTRGNKRFIRKLLGHIEMYKELGSKEYYVKQFGLSGKRV